MRKPGPRLASCSQPGLPSLENTEWFIRSQQQNRTRGALSAGSTCTQADKVMGALPKSLAPPLAAEHRQPGSPAAEVVMKFKGGV